MPLSGRLLPERGPVPERFQDAWLILWDGACSPCGRVVARILARSGAKRLMALPFQEAAPWLPETVHTASLQQFHLRSPENRYYGGGDAGIQLLWVLGHPWLANLLSFHPLRLVCRAAYRLLANTRRWWGWLV